jgi:hypothetical protein
VAAAATTNGLTIPVTGTVVPAGSFKGNFNITRFGTDSSGQLVAVGMLTGTITDASEAVVGSVAQLISVPMTASSRAPSTATAAAVTTDQQTSCTILHLDTGGTISLNLLGLVVTINEIVIDISAVPGAGNLLGNLLCGVANLLNQPSGLANLLNQILAAL